MRVAPFFLDLTELVWASLYASLGVKKPAGIVSFQTSQSPGPSHVPQSILTSFETFHELQLCLRPRVNSAITCLSLRLLLSRELPVRATDSSRPLHHPEPSAEMVVIYSFLEIQRVEVFLQNAFRHVLWVEHRHER